MPMRVATRLGRSMIAFTTRSAAKGDRKALRDESPTNEQVAFAALMRGVHW